MRALVIEKLRQSKILVDKDLGSFASVKSVSKNIVTLELWLENGGTDIITLSLNQVKNNFIAILNDEGLIRSFCVNEYEVNDLFKPESRYRITSRMFDVMKPKFPSITNEKIFKVLSDLVSETNEAEGI